MAPTTNKRLLAWAIEHDSHGISIDTMIFLPDGDKPEGKEKWLRLPWLDQPETKPPEQGKHERGIAANAVNEAIGAAKSHKQGLVNEVLGLLVGARLPLTPRQHQENAVNGILGVAIGAQVDLGHDDSFILGRCRDYLTKIRKAMVDPDIVKQGLDLQDKVK